MQLTDQKIFEATKLLYTQFQHDEVEHRLDIEHLDEFKKKHVKPLYPHKLTPEGKVQKYTCNEACCVVTPGYFCCCKTNKPDSSYRKLGLGICLYFKFLKHVLPILLIMAIVALLGCLICIWVATQNGFNISQSYSTFLYSTTLGVFASEHQKCQYSNITSQINPLYPYHAAINLSCPYGRIHYFGSVYSNESSNTLYNCRVEIQKFIGQSAQTSANTLGLTYSDNCGTSQSSCSVSMDLNSNYYGSSTVAFGYECVDQVYSLGSTAKSQTLFYVLVGFDLFCCLALTLFYISESKAQKEEIKYFKCQQLSLNDFSLKIVGVNLRNYDKELDIIIRSIAKILGTDFLDQLIQIKVPDRLDFIDYQNKKEQVYKDLYQFIENEFFDKDINPNKYKNADQFQNRNFPELKDFNEYKYQLTKRLLAYTKVIYIPQEVNDTKVSIYLVFSTIRMKKRVFQLQEEGCFSRYLLVDKKEYKVSQPPPPDLILWKNKGKRVVLRLIISWLLTLTICFGSFVLFGFIQAKQNSLLSEYNFNINCNVLFQSADLTIFNTTLSASNSNYFSCFCQKNLFNFNVQNSSSCDNFRIQYVTYLAIPIIISLFLVIYNVIVSFIFKLLTKFESHWLIIDELFSYTIKRAFLLIMNMGLIIIILNVQFQGNQNNKNLDSFNFLIQGKYNDITADWYLNIGTIIILTMIFNISFPLIELLLANILKCFKKCWDRKCCFKKTSCKTKEQYISLFSDDVYPIEQRYAFLIAIFIITLAFSCVIPLLYVICAISVFLLYLADKFLVFKVYQTPINYNAVLHELIRKAIYIGLISHMALSAVFLSQAQLVASNSMLSNQYQINSGNSRIDAMINTSYIIPYVILFLVYVGWSLFDNTIIAFCNKCSLLCKKNLSNITKYKLQQDYFECINHYQLLKLKRITQNQLHKMIVREQNNRNIIYQLNYSQNQTLKAFTAERTMSQHQAVLRRTLMKIQAEESLRRRERGDHDVFLIGMPGYEMMLSDEVFDSNKKNSVLTQGLNYCLGDIINHVENDRL